MFGNHLFFRRHFVTGCDRWNSNFVRSRLICKSPLSIYFSFPWSYLQINRLVCFKFSLAILKKIILFYCCSSFTHFDDYHGYSTWCGGSLGQTILRLVFWLFFQMILSFPPPDNISFFLQIKLTLVFVVFFYSPGNIRLVSVKLKLSIQFQSYIGWYFDG